MYNVQLQHVYEHYFCANCLFILQQSEMQRAVEFRFTDQSTLVREAAVDFVGRFILNRPELTLQYYDMLCQRIRVQSVYYHIMHCTYFVTYV